MAAAATHHKYAVMVKVALLAMKEHTVASVPAICKYIGANYAVPERTCKKVTGNMLNKLAYVGKLGTIKDSFKLSDAFKKPGFKPMKKSAPTQKAAPNTATAPGKVAPKKATAAPKKVAAPTLIQAQPPPSRPPLPMRRPRIRQNKFHSK
jgi:hypothetical protein